MRARVTATDSNDDPSSSEFVVTHDGERHEFDVASTGTIRGPDAVIKHMIAADGYAVAAFGDEQAGSDDGDDDAGGEDGDVTSAIGPIEDERSSDSGNGSDGTADTANSDDTDNGDS